jgi:hypothetical protein
MHLAGEDKRKGAVKMFFWMNRSPEERQGNTPMTGTMGPMGMMSGMPGPMMMTRMMPWMVGNCLAAESPDTRRERLLETVTGLIGQATGDFSDEDYDSLVEELTQRLGNREEVISQTPADCCG